MKKQDLILIMLIIVGLWASMPACAQRSGQLVAWGSNTFGQCDVPAGDDFVAVAAGVFHGLALKEDGSLVAWGGNSLGQCNVPSGNNFIAIDAGDVHSVALRSDGSIEAWGYNQSNVPSGNDFIAISASGMSSAALKCDGTIVAWCGPTSPPSGSDFVAIDTGYRHGVALRSDGSVESWAVEAYYDGNFSDPPSGNDFVSVFASSHGCYARKADGSIVSWGHENSYGVPIDNFVINNMPDTKDLFDISIHRSTVGLALKFDGSLVTWGHRSQGYSSVSSDKDFYAMTSGPVHHLAIRSPLYSNTLLNSYELADPMPTGKAGMTLQKKVDSSDLRATEGENMLQVDWTNQTNGKLEVYHNSLNFNSADEDILLIDVYMNCDYATTSTIFGIWNNDLGWHSTTVVPEPNQWCTLEFDISDSSLNNLNSLTFVVDHIQVDSGTLYIDNLRLKHARQDKYNLVAEGHDKRIDLTWEPVNYDCLQGYDIYRSSSETGPFTKLNSSVYTATVYSDFLNVNGQTYFYYIQPVLGDGYCSDSDIVSATSYAMTSDELLTSVQKATFRYFWNYGHPVSGMTRDKYPAIPETMSSGGTGMGIMAIISGIEQGFIDEEEGAERILRILKFLSYETPRYHGAWSHLINGTTGESLPFNKDEYGNEIDEAGDIIETSFVIQGVLAAREYFSNDTNVNETAYQIVAIADYLYGTVEWDWYLNGAEQYDWFWSPDTGWSGSFRSGSGESLAAYLLGIGSPNSSYAIDPDIYHYGYANTKDFLQFFNGQTQYGYTQMIEKIDIPLFWTHYSFLGLDPNEVTDVYCDYFVNNRNTTLINRGYCIANPEGFEGYDSLVWGLTSSTDPYDVTGYNVHAPNNDNGTISPTAALGAIPYTPNESIASMEHFYDNYAEEGLWGPFGFMDAFNLDSDPNWYSSQYLAIDQAPVVVMIENYRTGLFWDLVTSNTNIQNAITDIAGSGYPGPASIDNFDGDCINNGWIGNDTSVFTIDMSNTQNCVKGSYAMHVAYDKGGGYPWTYMYADISNGNKDWSMMSKFKFRIYSDRTVKYLIKLEYSGGAVEFECTPAADDWQTIVFDLDDIRDSLGNVNRVLIFPDAGVAGTAGEFWIDEMLMW